MNSIPTTGARFARMRRKGGWTQEKIARWFGVAVGTVNRWENEKSRLDRSAAILMWLLYDECVNHNEYAVRDYVRKTKEVRT